MLLTYLIAPDIAALDGAHPEAGDTSLARYPPGANQSCTV